MQRYSINSAEDSTNDYYCRCRSKICMCCVVVSCMVPVVIVIISTMIGLRFTMGASFTNNELDYGPTETRLIPYSNMFCQSLSLVNNYNGSEEYNLSLHILSDHPLLSELYVITIASIKEYQRKAWYLHPGSNVSFNACYNYNNGFVTYLHLHIAKGISRSVIKSFSFFDCKDGNLTFSHLFEEEDFYYFLIYSDCSYYCSLLVNLSISLNLTNYNLYNNTVISSCSISTSEQNSACSVSLPQSTNYALLTIQANSSDNIDIYDRISLETKCEPRVWLYVVPSIVAMLLMICCLSCCCIILYHFTVTLCQNCLICSSPYLLLLITISIVLGIRFHAASNYFLNHGNMSSATETRLIPISNLYCQSLNLQTTYNGSKEYNASLYLLSSRPKRYDQEQFTISEQIAAEIKHHYLFYLNSGSNITIDVCFVNASVIVPGTKLYIARGIDGYNGGHRLSDIKALFKKPIQYDCNNVSTVQYSVTNDDFYYFIFFTSTRGYIPVLHLNVNMFFHLTHYSLDTNITIVSSCSVVTSNYESGCSLNLPFSETNHALLVIEPTSSDVNRLDKISLETQCSIRLWGFVLPPFFPFMLVLFFIIRKIGLGDKIRQIIITRTFSSSDTYINLASPYRENKIIKKFNKAWSTEKGPVPEVMAVFVIHNKWRKFVRLLCWGFEEHYHGTKLKCDILTTQTLCNISSCAICSIAKSGFDKDKIGTTVRNFQRFGPGFYLAPNSSKSHAYTEDSYNCQAMLLCNVYPGRKYILSKNNETLDGPPRGYNSIFGIVGNDLNYKEIVIPSSNSHAIYPQYIIVY